MLWPSRKNLIIIHFQYKIYKMQNKPPLIMSVDAVNVPNQKYKFWDTSIAGNQRSPKNMSLVTASDMTNEQANELQRLQGSSQDPKDDHDQKSQSGMEPSEEDADEVKIRQLEQEAQRLRAQIEEGRVLNQNLLKELNKTTNQLRVAESLNTELNEECNKLYQSVKNAHERQSQVQKQKMDLLIQISSLNQIKELAVNKSEILEQQVQYLNKKLESLHEQISFEKSISGDLTRQSMILKQQLNKMMIMMQNYSQLQQEVARTHAINDEIQERVIKLEQELKNTRLQVKESENNEEIYAEEQNKLFLRIQQLDNETKVLTQKLNFTESQLRFVMEESEIRQSQQSQCEPRYVKVLQEYQKRNSDLIFEIMAVNERNHKLVEQRDFYMRRVEAVASNRNERLPYDQFVSILKATNDEVQIYKRKFELKQDEIQQLQSQFEHETLNMQQKIKQLVNIIEIRERQKQSQRQIIENEIQIYKKQCEMMVRKNEELKNNQVRLRLEVMEKDRIIIEFVEKQKIQDEIKSRQNL